MKSNGITYSQIENHLEPTAENRDYLWSLGLNKNINTGITWLVLQSKSIWKKKIDCKEIPTYVVG